MVAAETIRYCDSPLPALPKADSTYYDDWICTETKLTDATDAAIKPAETEAQNRNLKYEYCWLAPPYLHPVLNTMRQLENLFT